MGNLRRNAASGDVIWVYYSGHGCQNEDDYAASEEDKRDEAICPTDCDDVGLIWDNWLSSDFAKRLPQGTQTIMMFDCCHSGTALDLPYQYEKGWEKTRPANPDDPFVLYLSGCSDRQLSKEANALYFDGFLNGWPLKTEEQRGGVLTSKFLRTAKKHCDNAPLKKYLDSIQLGFKLNWLYWQSPCVSSSHRISVKEGTFRHVVTCFWDSREAAEIVDFHERRLNLRRNQLLRPDRPSPRVGTCYYYGRTQADVMRQASTGFYGGYEETDQISKTESTAVSPKSINGWLKEVLINIIRDARLMKLFGDTPVPNNAGLAN